MGIMSRLQIRSVKGTPESFSLEGGEKRLRPSIRAVMYRREKGNYMIVAQRQN